jgi:hypothetical protein
MAKISDTLHEFLKMFYCCRQHIFAEKSFLFNNQYYFIVDEVIQINNKCRAHCCLSVAVQLGERDAVLGYT